jgi:serine/threonine protein kinase
VLAQEQTFGEYRIERRVGVGRVGAIYRATHLRLGRPVALKVVPPERTTDAETRARLVRESVLVAKLDHPNIIPIYEAGEIEGSLFIAMRWVDGTDLETTLAQSGALPPTQALRIAQQVAGALDAAHAARLLHRDVKPANVLLTRPGTCT